MRLLSLFRHARTAVSAHTAVSSHFLRPAQSRLISMSHPSLGISRTHTCGQLRLSDAGSPVVLSGWLTQPRRMGGLFFALLRDCNGVTQIIASPEGPGGAETLDRLSSLSPESVITVQGQVVARPLGQANAAQLTGEIELDVSECWVENRADPLPFRPGDKERPKEETRLRHRHLDLRGPTLLPALKTRHSASRAARLYLEKHNFLEVETPTLTRPTADSGAREFTVPTRQRGLCYTLAQSPQLYKQLLMAGGVDRYFQFARCYRDENLRADRQPEFTQIDLEMAFAGKEDVQDVVEGLIASVWKKVLGVTIPHPFPRITYHEAMTRFGTDKPDTRIHTELINVSSVASNLALSGNAGDKTIALLLPQLGHLIDDYASTLDVVVPDCSTIAARVKGPPPPGMTVNDWEAVRAALDGGKGDLILFARGSEWRPHTALGRARVAGASLVATPEETPRFDFLWVEDFPLFQTADDDDSLAGRLGRGGEECSKLESTHHPFTAPHPDDADLLDSSPLSVRGQHYDIVVNGIELGGGSVRIHDASLQRHILVDLLSVPEEEVVKVAPLLNALSHGCPPHAGIAFGFDRMAMVLAKRQSLRDVTAFPKTAAGNDLVMGAPAPVPDSALALTGLRWV